MFRFDRRWRLIRQTALIQLLATAVLTYGCSSDLAGRLDGESQEARGDDDREPEPSPGQATDAGAPSPTTTPSNSPNSDGGATPSEPRVCPPGTFIGELAEDGTMACNGCPSGSFAAGADAAECDLWTDCQPGEYVSVRGSAMADQECAACPEDSTTTTVNAGACLPVDACQAGTVEVAPADGDKPAKCEDCEPGNFCAGGSSLAHACTDGTWDHDRDPGTDCVDQTLCPIGQWVTRQGNATRDRTCADCKEGTFTLEMNATECQSVAECAPGTFVDVPGSTIADATCTACAPGSFSDVSNAAECAPWTECQPGSFVAGVGSSMTDQLCEECPEGEFSESVNAPGCTADGECAPGTRQTEAGTADSPSTCEPCAVGEYCAGGETPVEACIAGTWDHDADPSTPCIAHTECQPGSRVESVGDAVTDQSCASCAAGTFTVSANVLECQPWQDCAPGTFVQTQGSATSDVACSGCASGTFTDSANEASCVTWTDCQPGQFVDDAGTNTGDRVCASCPSGQYSASINAGTCVDAGACAPGTVETSPATQSSPAQCAACSAGTYCAGGQAASVTCSSSTWDNDADPATPCVARTTCAAGQYVVSGGSATSDRTCAACASGQYSSSQNASSCTAWSTCAAGTYVQSAGSSTSNRQCTACSSGSFSTTTNASSCTNWTTCSAPSFYMTNTPNATTDRQCAACTPPAVTSTNNASMCTVPAFQMSGGTVVFEAENYTSTSANGSSDTWSSVTVSGISGSTCMETGPDDNSMWTSSPATTAPRLVYYVNFTTTGTFNVFIRGDDKSGADISNSCFAGIDNVQFGSHYIFPTGSNQWQWPVQQVTVSTTGIHTFTIWAREDGTRIDKVVISTSSTAPSGNGPSESPKN